MSRKIDALIAKHVFGLKDGPYSDNGSDRFYPAYSREINYAWEVVEKMRENKIYLSLFDAPTVTSRFTDSSDDNEYSEIATTAICKAALKALGIEVPN